MEDRIRDKIKKLLALANGSDNENESYVALTKAQALMAEYKINEKDITNDVKRQCIQKITSISFGTRSSDVYLAKLAEIIADNFCCVEYFRGQTGKSTYYVAFTGYEEDVDIAIEALQVAHHAIIKGYDRVYKNLQKLYQRDYIPAAVFNPAKLGYAKGYIDGLKTALDTQRYNIQGYELVLVAPDEAQKFIDSLGSISLRNKSRRTSLEYYREGYEDGTNFELSKKIK